MAAQPILLTVLLRQAHSQPYGRFCAAYDQAAQRIDPGLAGSYPSRAQHHRWLSGTVRSQPYPHHCRVLQEMFPGWTARQLFQPCPAELLHAPPPPGHDTPPGPAAMPSVGIRPFIERAFSREHVTIDFAGFSGETLHGVIQEPLDTIRVGRHKPASLAVRMLLPDTTRPMTLPCRADDLSDDPGYRDRAARISARHAQAITDSVDELRHLAIIENAAAQIRYHPCAPLFKLYILNGEEAFFGFYPIIKHDIPLATGTRAMYDLMGKDALVFRHSARSGNPADVSYLQQAQTWFDAMWQTISHQPA